jgi:threonine synthase
MWRYKLRCFDCKGDFPEHETGFRCKNCGELLEVRFELEGKRAPAWNSRQLSVWRYRELLPIEKEESIVSLAEGGTGLHPCIRLGRKLGLKKLYVKNEGENPTGSFKDRGMTVAISKAKELGKRKVLCASTGNTAASLAAYSARAGMECIVLIPKGKVAVGKMLQVTVHGAKIIQVKGDFDQAFKTALELAERKRELYLMNSINPYRLEGQKTLAFEIFDQLDSKTPETVILPVGNGGNISAAWKGFTEFQQLSISKTRPRMVGIQAEKASPIAQAVKRRENKIRPVSNPQTIATAIRIGSPVNWPKVLKAIKESKGTAETVTDSEILEAQRELATLEGIFVEPASAASIAGLKKLRVNGRVDSSEIIVCVTTGHGLKDPSVLERLPKSRAGYNLEITNRASLDALERVL